MARTALAMLVVLLAVAHDASAKPGDLDRRFGTKGVFTARILDGGWAATVQWNGRILVAGGIYEPGLVRLTPRGRADRSFGAGGFAHHPGVRDVLPFGVRTARGAGIRVAAATTTTGTPPVELLRFSADGRGIARATHAPFFPGPIRDGVMRPDGGAIVASLYHGRLRSIRPDGTTDTAWGRDGEIDLEDGYAYVDALALDRSGRLLVAGGSGLRPTIDRYTRQGKPDRTWGGDGSVTVPFAVDAVKPLPGGDVIAAGARGKYVARAFRLSRTGARRTRFGADGIAGRQRFLGGGSVRDVAVDGRGRIYILTEGRRRLRIVALTGSGRLLLRFGRRGLAGIPESRRVFADAGERLLLDGRGGLVVVGSRLYDGTSHSAFGCDIRDDLCATDVRLAVWRVKR